MTVEPIGTARVVCHLLDVTPKDLYSEEGAIVYRILTEGDDDELDEIIRVAGSNGVDRICELACGAGRLTIPLSDLGFDVVGVDNSRAMLSYLDGAGRQTGRRIRAVHSDIREIRDVGSGFDLAVLATSSVSLFGAVDRRRVLQSVGSILKPNGLLYISVGEPSDQDGREERHFAFRRGTTTYMIVNTFAPEQGYRQTTIIKDEPGAQPDVLLSNVELVSSDVLEHELIEAGYEVVERKTRPNPLMNITHFVAKINNAEVKA